MTLHVVDSLEDPRLDAYRRLKDRDLTREGRFIAEGLWIVRRLLASSLKVESILASPRRADEVSAKVGERCPVYILSPDRINQLLGFRFHAGILACGFVPESPRLDQIPAMADLERPARLLVFPKIINPANLGAIIRSAAALGADAVVLGPECCEPFYRQSVRLSMGAVFNLPVIRSTDMHRDLDDLAQLYDVKRWATVVRSDAKPIHTMRPPHRLALIIGPEDHGLGDELLAHCDQRITIPMRGGMDSLNVIVAASIFLFWAAGSS
ncbi:MAG: RNA methyltransferase [Phycisphaeraceae bacterium]|nr:RNA methyltransferase [Phycisphaeraceae bacterium]